MQTITTKLTESRTRLFQQGSQFVEQSTGAATVFLEKTRKAQKKFADDTRKAGLAFAASSTEAGKSLVSGVGMEAKLWLETLEASVKVPALPSSTGAGAVPTPKALERELLVRVEDLLAQLVGKVHARVELLSVPVDAQLPATSTTSASTGAGAPAKRENGARATSPGTLAAVPPPPIGNYDELSAKEIVTRLERLTDEKTAAVLAYENATKKRATVLRAAEQRLAAEA